MQSKLLADENIPWPLVRLLRNTGIDMVWIPETAYRGISDKEIADLANSNRRTIAIGRPEGQCAPAREPWGSRC